MRKRKSERFQSPDPEALNEALNLMNGGEREKKKQVRARLCTILIHAGPCEIEESRRMCTTVIYATAVLVNMESHKGRVQP